LRFATIEQREIFLMQIFDDFSCAFPHHDADKNRLTRTLENGRRVGVSTSGFLGSCGVADWRSARESAGAAEAARLRAFIASGRRLGK